MSQSGSRVVLLLALTMLSAAGCGPPPGHVPLEGDRLTFRPEAIQPLSLDASRLALLRGDWRESYEEHVREEPDVHVFRPADWDFPDSRFRRAFTLHADGRLRWFVLADDDAHHFVDGGWSVDDEDPTLVHLVPDGHRPVKIRFVEVGAERLRLAFVP